MFSLAQWRLHTVHTAALSSSHLHKRDIVRSQSAFSMVPAGLFGSRLRKRKIVRAQRVFVREKV